MTAMVLAIAPSYWQRTLFGFIALSVIAPTLAFILIGLRRAVLDPWSARRRWPEGAGWGATSRIPAELLTDVQRSVATEAEGGADLADAMSALRVGAAFAALAVIPASTGLVVAQPGFGVFVLPVCVVVDAVAVTVAGRVRHARTGQAHGGRRAQEADADIETLERAAVLIAAACLLALAGGAVVAQWGSTSLAGIVHAQAHGSVASVAGWGLPTAVVQAPAAIVALCGLYLLVARLDGDRGSIPPATARGLVDQVARALWIVAGASWVAVCFGGGGDVPWMIPNDGVRHVVSALLLVGKTTLIAVAISWFVALRPTISRLWVRRILVAGAIAMVGSIAVTATVRTIV